jgi:hypothetical protein
MRVMKKRRTKNQKAAAVKHYQLGSWYNQEETQISKPSTGVLQRQEVSSIRPGITAMILYGYEPKLIRRDLIKTIIVTLLILMIETGLYLKLH